MGSVETLDSPVGEKQAGAAVDVTEATKDLENIKHAHEFDPNLPQEKIDFLNKALQDGDADEILAAETIFTDDSPYIEVRAAVRNTDGEEVANTVRAWILGMIFVTIGSGLNMFLSMRSPAINFPSLVVQLLVYPIGCLWAKVVPTREFSLFGLKWTFNTGPFTIKEHVVIVLMSNVSIGKRSWSNFLFSCAWGLTCDNCQDTLTVQTLFWPFRESHFMILILDGAFNFYLR